MPTLYSMVNETGNRNRILEMCEFRIWFRLATIHNPHVQNSLPIFTKFCTRLKNVGARTPICERNRMQFADFRGVRSPISALFRLW